jgi:hypothetical protein
MHRVVIPTEAVGTCGFAAGLGAQCIEAGKVRQRRELHNRESDARATEIDRERPFRAQKRKSSRRFYRRTVREEWKISAGFDLYALPMTLATVSPIAAGLSTT